MGVDLTFRLAISCYFSCHCARFIRPTETSERRVRKRYESPSRSGSLRSTAKERVQWFGQCIRATSIIQSKRAIKTSVMPRPGHQRWCLMAPAISRPRSPLAPRPGQGSTTGHLRVYACGGNSRDEHGRRRMGSSENDAATQSGFRVRS